MCQFKSGIILKNKIILAPEGNESHSDLLENMEIEDTRENAMRVFVRAELLPKDGNKASDISEWKFNVDQDITPDWFDKDPGKYEEEFRREVKDYLKDKLLVIAGYPWDKAKDGKYTYYFMNGIWKEMKFGKNNNYAESDIKDELTHSELAKNLKEEFGDKLVPISLDLLSLDGLDDYGTVEGDIIAIPNIDIYRRFRKEITKLDSWYWLATPDSTPSSCGSDYVRCVGSGGYVGCFWCDGVVGVRPFWYGRRNRVGETPKLESHNQKNKRPFSLLSKRDKYKGIKFYEKKIQCLIMKRYVILEIYTKLTESQKVEKGFQKVRLSSKQ